MNRIEVKDGPQAFAFVLGGIETLRRTLRLVLAVRVRPACSTVGASAARTWSEPSQPAASSALRVFISADCCETSPRSQNTFGMQSTTRSRVSPADLRRLRSGDPRLQGQALEKLKKKKSSTELAVI